jgi:oligopeptide transport system substrate-binding protein
MFMSDNGNNRTGWKDPRYDALVREANSKTNIKVRAELLRQAETILVHDEAPVVPLFFYKGFDYFDPSKVQGIYFNILDQHPLSAIRRVGREARAESRVDQATVKSNGKQEDRK